MSLSFMKGIDDGKPTFSTYLEALLQALNQKYIETGCEVTPVSGSLSVNVSSGTVKYGSDEYSVNTQTLTINGTTDYVRYDVIVWDYNNGSPAVTVLQGSETLQLNDGSVVYKTPKISDSQIPLAVVRVRPSATELISDDIFDVRVRSASYVDIGQVEDYFETTGVLNVKYDNDLDGVVEQADNADTVDGLQASQFLRKDVADTKNGDLTISGNLIPGSDNVYDFGNGDYRWKKIYGNDVDISGTVYIDDLPDWTGQV